MLRKVHPQALTPVLLTLVLSVVILAASPGLTRVGSAALPPSETTTDVVMNFHAYSLLYKNLNMSIFIYVGADTNPPTYATQLGTMVSCSSSLLEMRQFLPFSAQDGFGNVNAWLGGISWITQPLNQDMVIRGNMSMTLWMSTPSQEAEASGYAFGIVEVDDMGNAIGEPIYQYHYDFGNVFGSSPNPYRLDFSVDRTFAKGNRISFFAVTGATSEGWLYQVYFDSAAMNSFAVLPVVTLPVPEFSQIGIAVTMSLAVLATYVVRRRRG